VDLKEGCTSVEWAVLLTNLAADAGKSIMRWRKLDIAMSICAPGRFAVGDAHWSVIRGCEVVHVIAELWIIDIRCGSKETA